jgi:hypothetical protein
VTVVVAVLLGLEIVLAGVLVRSAVALRDRIAATEGELDARAVESARKHRPGGPANPVLLVEILNPRELAARESWAARHFGSLVPRVVGREVASRAAEQMAEQLAEQGVRAEVRIVAPRE